MEIPAPSHVLGDTNRSMECEEHFHEPIRRLVDQAISAGWTPQEVLIAIEEVVKDLRAVYKDRPLTDGDNEPSNDWPAAT